MQIENRRKFDVIVLGTGLAGLATALSAAEEGLEVLCVSKDEDFSQTNTSLAQGGIVFKGEGDSPELLAADIRRAGAGISSDEAVHFIAREGPRVVEEVLINQVKVPFDASRRAGEHHHLTAEGAHSVARIIHVADHTGRAIQEAIQQACLNHEGITMLAGHTAIDLLTVHHHSSSYQFKYQLENECVGIYLLDNEAAQVKTLFADAVVLATGGAGRLFRHTTNAFGSVGSGLVMAYRAGAYLLNTEFVQFHPTALFHPQAHRFLISEALRGEGARLKNSAGEYFMERYDPERRDLAPRDIVARAIVEEMLRTGDQSSFLDLAGHYDGKTPIEERFPTIYETCLELGIDITRDAIPVVPAAHYICGGVVVNRAGRSTMRRLYAVGEVTCSGVHGANRLASTSLLEAVTWGHHAGQDMARFSKEKAGLSKRVTQTIPDWYVSGATEEHDPALVVQDWQTIRSTMWNYVGIVRTKDRLERAVADMADLRKRLTKFYHDTKISRELTELFQGTMAAHIVASAALTNTRSRGAHFRQS